MKMEMEIENGNQIWKSNMEIMKMEIKYGNQMKMEIKYGNQMKMEMEIKYGNNENGNQIWKLKMEMEIKYGNNENGN